MKKTLIHIVCLALLCTLLPACSQDSEQAVESTRTVMLSFNVSTRAAGDSDNVPGDLMLWVYGKGNDVPLFHAAYEKVNWTQHTPVGEEEVEFTTFFTEKVDVDKEYPTLTVYAVVNASSVDMKNVTLGSNTTETELKTAQFGLNTTTQTLGDNQLLAFGTQTKGDLKLNDYNAIEVVCERCMSKLELYITKLASNKNDLKIKNITLRKVPSIGYLTPQESLPKLTTDDMVADVILLDKVEGEPIETQLDVKVKPEEFADCYDADNSTFTSMQIAAPYLLERKGYSPWGTVLIKDTYFDAYDAYILSLTYNRGGENDYTKHVVLEEINRNWRYRIFLRIKGHSEVLINTSRVPWKKYRGQIEIDVTYGKNEDGLTVKEF